MSKFLTLLEAKQAPDDDSEEGRGKWTILTALRFQSDLFERIFEVEAGFVTDFGSVPRIPFVFDTLGGRGNAACALHDRAYSGDHFGLARVQADALLKEALIATGVNKVFAWSIYLGVRLGGRSHWQ